MNKIRRFEKSDATQVANLIQDNLLHVNVADYDLPTMKLMAEEYQPDDVLKMASYAHTYVLVDKTDHILATGSISNYWDIPNEAILLCVFVQPDLQHKHLGQQIMQTLMSDDIYLRSTRIEIPASKTAVKFYQRFGFNFKDGQEKLDDDGHIRLEIFKKSE